MAEPLKITPAVAESVCDELAEGVKSLRQICREKGFSHTAFLLQVRANEELANQYTRAREQGCDAAFDGLREMSTESPQMAEHGVDSGWVAWKRVQVDTLKWELSKRNPRVYGDKQLITGGDGSGPIQAAITINLVDSSNESS